MTNKTHHTIAAAPRAVWLLAALVLGAVLALPACEKEPPVDPVIASMPDGLVLYPRGRIENVARSEYGTQVVLTTSSDAAAIAQWYMDNLKKNGWEEPGKVEGNPTVITTRKIDASLSVTVNDPGSDEKQIITINYTDRFR